MTVAGPTVVLVAPFWPWPGHVGVYRVERFARWLAAAGADVVLVRAGRTDGLEEAPWGSVVRVADPLRFFPDRYAPVGGESSGGGRPARRPRLLRRLAALALAPDPSVLWSLRAAAHAPLLARAGHARWVLSSSPPESAHVLAARLARRLGARLAVDLRDGWLDEPPRAELSLAWRRRLEGAMERSVIRRADRVFVTSDVWRDMLVRRLPFAASKTTVLTNAYPEADAASARDGAGKGSPSPAPGAGPVLLHAGRFSSSRADRTMDGLLAPLEEGMRRSGVRGTIALVGELDERERADAARWRGRLEPLGWRLDVEPAVPRAELLARCRGAGGLLLNDPSPAVLPSKLFEYIPTRRPIFAAARPGGALAAVVGALPQGFVATGDRERDGAAAAAFIAAAACARAEGDVPERFAEPALSRAFLAALELAAP